MQYAVPQFILAEDKIIGPLTVRQFVIIIVGGVLMFVFWSMADMALFVLLAIIDLAIVVAFAFVKINGRPFQDFLTAFIQFNTKPKIRFWFRETALKRIKMKMEQKQMVTKEIEEAATAFGGRKLVKSQLNDLSNQLDRDMTADLLAKQIEAQQQQ